MNTFNQITYEYDKKLNLLKELVEYNNHTEALLEVTRILGFEKYEKMVKYIIEIEKLEGYLPSSISDYIRYVKVEMKRILTQHFDESQMEVILKLFKYC